ncbi:MAG: T9SS type A sorting domain-containing protein [Paludibacter sp.]|nr:T9SS type A sorting domain-containing protein [Paludibacter sp.]
MKKTLLIFSILLMAFGASSQSVTITESAGWLETAFVKWQPLDGVESYNVYYSGEGITDQKIDNQLVRNYGTYFRADIMGLKAGQYTVKVVPVISGVEGTASETSGLTILAQDRTGFAFSNNRVPGAYKADGTPKDNAVILYITENTKNAVSLNVTGANSNPCVGIQTILDGFKKGKDIRPLIVRLIGQISDMNYMLGGDIVIENDNNTSSYITFEGVGDDAVADGWGVRIKNASNVEVRNIGFMNCNSDEGDNVGLQQGNDYIWLHNCDMFYGDAGSDADQAKGDGALDCKKSTYVTFSYNHFWDSGKCNLLGLSEGTTSGLYITYHHNWYDHSDSRHPRVRFYSAHVYNNYYDGNSKYGVGSTEESSVFVEANYFRHCKYPMLTSMQGSDVYDESKQANDYKNMPTFSSEDGGTIKAFNNYMTDQRRFVPYGDSNYPNSTTDFDAYVVSTRSETVPSTVKSAYGSNTYNNFDVDNSVMYSYTPDSPEDAKTNVMQYAGRVSGGDFTWTFDNSVDDAAYAVNAGLKSALTAYKTSLVSIQGDSVATGGGNTGGNTGGGSSSGDMVQNFTVSGTESSFYNISGNLSTSKGTVIYNDLTLTQCLKIESSTSISFTTTESGIYTLVFNDSFSGKIYIDDVAYNAASGVITTELTAGSHQVKKGDSANLYYMSIAYNTTEVSTPETTEISLFPNPVSDKLQIRGDATLQKVEVYSLSGMLLKQSIGSNNIVDLSSLHSGSYLVRVNTNQGVSNQIIFKK